MTRRVETRMHNDLSQVLKAYISWRETDPELVEDIRFARRSPTHVLRKDLMHQVQPYKIKYDGRWFRLVTASTDDENCWLFEEDRWTPVVLDKKTLERFFYTTPDQPKHYKADESRFSDL